MIPYLSTREEYIVDVDKSLGHEVECSPHIVSCDNTCLYVLCLIVMAGQLHRNNKNALVTNV